MWRYQTGSETEPDSMVLPPCPLPDFCLQKNFSQRSLIREVRKCRNKGKQSEKINNNKAVIKHSQGPLGPSRGL